MLLYSLLSLLLVGSAGQLAARGAYNEAWLTPTPETDPTYFRGGMPLGNGDTQALAWANVSAGGVSIYVSKNDAMASDTSAYKLALLTLALHPSPYLSGAFFNQTLDIATATLLLTVGGTASAPAAALSVWVDAHSNTVYATAASLNASQTYTYTATLEPIRPNGYAPYRAPWHCTLGGSAPDVVLADADLPPTLPAPAATLVILHENSDDDLASGPIVPAVLQAQGLGGAATLATVPDLWRGRRFGVAVDAVAGSGGGGGGGGCAALRRTSPLSLQSLAPAPCVALRVSALASNAQPTRQAWLAALAAQVAAQPPAAPPRAPHEAFWQAFWTSTYVDINATDAPAPAAAAAGAPPGVPADALLWLRAAALAPGAPNHSAVAAWGPFAQAAAAQRPALVLDALGPGLPGVRFTQAQRTFLAAPGLALPASGAATLVVVLKDQGSDGGSGANGACCSGVLSFCGHDFFGLSTRPGQGGSGGDDDLGPSDDPAPAAHAVNLLGDFGDSQLASPLNIRGRTVLATVAYSATGAAGSSSTATLYIDGVAQGSSAVKPASAPTPGAMLGSRGADAYERYFEGLVGEVLVYNRTLSASELGSVSAFFASAYSLPAGGGGGGGGASVGFRVSQAYAMSRYMNAAQSRGGVPGGSSRLEQQPVKFNGLAWTSRRPGAATACSGVGGLGPDCREWGPDNWWQNVRLPYWPMLADGDWQQMDVLLDYYLRMAPFLRARAQALRPNASRYPDMLWMTETATVFGAFSEVDWVGDGDCAAQRPRDLPLYLQANPYIYLDAFGDGPTGELALMILDRYLYDANATALAARLPWVFGALDYFAHAFYDAAATPPVTIAPTQACETFWSPWPISPAERVVNDAPTIAVVTRLLARALRELPPALAPPPPRAALWAALLAAMPPLPATPDGAALAPAAAYNAARSHNSESTAMYAVHPARHFSVGRLLSGGVASLAPAIATFYADANAGGSPAGNQGWHQGTMHAPLLGLRAETGALLRARAAAPAPLPGFRFRFFSGEPGMAGEAAAEVFSNLASGVQLALLQPGDDGAQSVAVLPGWPCAWGVRWRLRAPGNTSVEGVWEGGALQSLVVQPPERAPAVRLAPGC